MKKAYLMQKNTLLGENKLFVVLSSTTIDQKAFCRK